MNAQLSVPKSELADFCQAHGIQRLANFGSALRADFGPESYIDVLVEIAPDRAPGQLDIAGMEIEWLPPFGGSKVDLQTPADLSRYFRQEVLDMADVQYAQG